MGATELGLVHHRLAATRGLAFESPIELALQELFRLVAQTQAGLGSACIRQPALCGSSGLREP